MGLAVRATCPRAAWLALKHSKATSRTWISCASLRALTGAVTPDLFKHAPGSAFASSTLRLACAINTRDRAGPISSAEAPVTLEERFAAARAALTAAALRFREVNSIAAPRAAANDTRLARKLTRFATDTSGTIRAEALDFSAATVTARVAP
jgi:hypothetical protein